MSSHDTTRKFRGGELHRATCMVLNEIGSATAVHEIIVEVQRLLRRKRRADSIESSVRQLLSRETLRKRGAFVRTQRGHYDLRERVEARLKQRIRTEIQRQGLQLGTASTSPLQGIPSKEFLRSIHRRARFSKYTSMREFVAKKEPELLNHFANGTELDVDKFTPRVEAVESGTWQSDLFRYATLLWSVPVSEGFGRRVRFLVWDESNHKLVGLFALGDPVFNLRCRDQWIGWDANQRKERLYNMMDIFILGAVPPYNGLLAGKLVALLATSNEVRTFIERRYTGRPTILERKKKNPRLVLMTTGSALGRSSLYDRIKYNGALLYQRIGSSQGWGHFHLNGGLFEEMKAYVAFSDQKRAFANRFGDGPNWKIRVARECLEGLGLSGDLLRHGIGREIYAIPLAKNFRQFLLGEHDRVQSFDLPFDELSRYFKERWMYGRALARPEYREYEKTAISQAIHSARIDD